MWCRAAAAEAPEPVFPNLWDVHLQQGHSRTVSHVLEVACRLQDQLQAKFTNSAAAAAAAAAAGPP